MHCRAHINHYNTYNIHSAKVYSCSPNGNTCVLHYYNIMYIICNQTKTFVGPRATFNRVTILIFYCVFLTGRARRESNTRVYYYTTRRRRRILYNILLHAETENFIYHTSRALPLCINMY